MVKKICFAIIAFIGLQGCEGLLFLALLPSGVERSVAARFYNDSPFSVAASFCHCDASCHDTTLLSWDKPPIIVIKPLDKWEFEFFGCRSFKYVFEDCDTLSFFIFNQDTIAAYPWEKIQNEYKVCARYDFSLKDANAGLNDSFSFTPTEKMKDIHMSPKNKTNIKQLS